MSFRVRVITFAAAVAGVLTGCDDDGSAAAPFVLVEVVNARDLVVGDTIRLGLTSRGKTLPVARWISLDTSVVAVDAGGLATAKRRGIALIVGTSTTNDSAAAAIEVSPR